jgi:hypothetical protein
MAPASHGTAQEEPVKGSDDVVRSSSPLDDMYLIQREVRGLIHDQLQLAMLELRLASRSLVTMISAAVCVGALLVLVWLGLMAVLGLGLVETGMHPVPMMSVLTALTSVLVLLLFVLIQHHLREFGFPATLRTLQPSPVGDQRHDSSCP